MSVVWPQPHLPLNGGSRPVERPREWLPQTWIGASQTHNHRVWECEGTLCSGGGHKKEDLRAVYSLDLIIISAPESF